MVGESISMEMIKAEALRLGFVLCSVTTPAPPANFQVYKQWIKAGYHAGMDYLARPDQIAKKQDPHALMEDVRCILVLVAPYPRSTELLSLPSGFGRVSSYAWGKDYHIVVQEKAIVLGQWLCATYGEEAHFLSFTDSAPISERELACRAGLGWIGKNTCLINPAFGSYFFLAEIFLNITLPAAEAIIQDRCGSCRRCIEACPTHCLNEDRTMDARRCISYLTIENKGDIPIELRHKMGDWIFGCDSCQQVCPWNKKNAATPLPEFSSSALSLDIKDILQLSDMDFRTRFKESPILRAKRFGIIRNAILVAANQKDANTLDELCFIRDNDTEPVLRNMAAWAIDLIRSKD